MTGGADGGGQILIKLETSFMRGFLQLLRGTKLQKIQPVNCIY